MTTNDDDHQRTPPAARIALAALERILPLVDELKHAASARGERFALRLHLSPPTTGGFRSLDPAPPDLLMRVQGGGDLDGIVEDASIRRLTEVLGDAAPWFDSLPDASTLTIEVREDKQAPILARVHGSVRGGYLEATEVSPPELANRMAADRHA